jgi:hypothetical protein
MPIIVLRDYTGKPQAEVYRGEFRGSTYAALDKAEIWMQQNGEVIK